MQHDHSIMHPCDTTVLGNMDAEIGLLQAASWLHRKRTNQNALSSNQCIKEHLVECLVYRIYVSGINPATLHHS